MIILSFGVGNIDHLCQKELDVIKNTENFLPETLYKPGFNKLSPIWELFWMDWGLSFTCFAEIIWPLTQADRNTFHSFQVCTTDLMFFMYADIMYLLPSKMRLLWNSISPRQNMSRWILSGLVNFSTRLWLWCIGIAAPTGCRSQPL